MRAVSVYTRLNVQLDAKSLFGGDEKHTAETWERLVAVYIVYVEKTDCLRPWGHAVSDYATLLYTENVIAE